MKTIIEIGKWVVAPIALVAVVVSLFPIMLLAKLGNKWAVNFLEEGAEPMDVYGIVK